MATTYQRDPATGQILFDASGYPLVLAAPNNTFGLMQTRVQYEVLGSPLASDVQSAINDAIKTFDLDDFWFTDIRYFQATGSASTFQTTSGKEFYSDADLPILVNMPNIDKLLVLAFGNRYSLINRTPQWIDDQSLIQTFLGLPTDWSWQGGSLRLYPIPNATYPLIMAGTIRFAPLSADSDTNPWMDEGEKLIRFEAKRLLFTHITRDIQQAQVMAGEVANELARLKRETRKRLGSPGRIRPSQGYF